jgi:hypothetical protein
MAIQIETESIVTLTEATKILPPLNGRRPAISTLWRWCRKGLRGVHLEYIRVGRNIATSREALGRFVNRLAEADRPLETPPLITQPSLPRSEQRRGRAPLAQSADDVLARAGI